MINIDSIFSFAFNTAYDIRDAIENNKPVSIDKSTVTLVCIVDDTLPLKTVNQYCDNLEVIYASFIRSLLSVTSKSRIDSDAKGIFKTIPLLTPYDKVAFNKKLNAFESVKSTLFNDMRSSSSIVSKFAEEMKKEMELREMALNGYSYAMEADVIQKESRGAVPTFVNIPIMINSFGKTVEKNVSIGVRVIPKIMSREEVASFFIKRGKMEVTAPKDGFMSKLKSMLSLSKSRLSNLKINSSDKKTLFDMFSTVSKINKPFVAVLMSNSTASIIENAGIKIMSADMLRKIYDNYPVVSIGVLDTHLDTITVSLTRDTTYVKQTLAEFNSEVASYERELAELVRSNSRF
ncbi:MAG: hypothetical protein ACRC92_27155 [Peptostreptococcaceae bacterium]